MRFDPFKQMPTPGSIDPDAAQLFRASHQLLEDRKRECFLRRFRWSSCANYERYW